MVGGRNTGEDAWREYIIEEGLDSELTLIRVFFHPDSLELETKMGDSLKGRGYESKIFDLLLTATKELNMPLVVIEANEEFTSIIEDKKLKENITRINTRTYYSTLWTFVISEPSLQKEHEIIAKRVWDFFRYESKMYTKEEFEAL